jgi:DNA polymerase phi
LPEGLFAASASTERKSLGLQVVSMGISTAPVQLLHAVFSPNAMRCIINQRAGQDRYLHEAAKGPLSQMVTRSKSDQESIPVMLKGLLSGNGAVDFDRLTKSKTAEDLFARAKDESAADALTILQQLSAKPNAEDQPQADTKRRLLADMMLNMARKQQAEEGKNNENIASLVLSMVPFGYADATAGALKASPSLSEASQEMFRSRLMSCLNHILSARMDTEFTILEKVVEEVKATDAASKTGLRTKADQEIVDNLDKAHKTLKALKKLEQKQKNSKKAPLRAFKALYALSILLVYNGEADVVPVLEDLELCYQSWKKSEDASVMLVEILLSFISKPSAVYRKIAQQVFEAFSSQLDAEGLQSMLDILEKSENLSGQQELFEQADDVEDDGESGSDEDASDVEMIDGEVGSDVELDSDVEVVEDAESGASEDDSDGEADAEDADLEDFENKLALALKTQKPTEDDSDFDESDMDDEQMMALEGHLTTIFTERKKNTSNKKKDNKDAKENIVNFKNRVLDLLTIFAKQEHTNKLTLDLVLPMITLIKTTTSKQISEKAFGLLQQFFNACNKTKQFPEADEASEVLALLQSVHEEIRANASKLHSNACSRSSLFLAKILVNMDAKHYSDVADCYSNLQKEWYADPKSQIQPSVFTEWTSWSITTKKHNN